MNAFVLRCEHNDYLTSTVVQVAASDAEWPGLDEATHELAEHVIGTHGDPERLTFTAVEVVERDGWGVLGGEREIIRERDHQS